ncbi:YveK family protein [Priestia filamentosa]|uniref:YveK family protein n=1 Tax=Priestia filamentosa TaxID=1402861 RepID=UPI000A087F2F|nr:Wzz/FepE/Etk N-terminal domain-containing protein [Priestia filamentosa]MDT3763943.1 Wzz/FepE/Etk N-terminal domain-containing protein [Priestia filamentosa]OXS71581.1 capsular biosynthesis protein [Priestia filamentosa]WRU94352.1 Wzz/FepE/Etk N-terminal domain-containing protein [Priestia filamentosa]SMF11048.1 Capsular polysaccharide biosynthesis protein [Priestia filamentosa]
MEGSINLRERFQPLKKHLLLISIITVILTIASGIVSYFLLTPIYQSSTQILVNQSKNGQQIYSANELQTNLQLVNTYNVIIKSPAILDEVIKKEDLKMTSGALNKLISVSSEEDSQVVNVTVQYKNPQKAADIANAIATTFQNEIKKIMNVDNVSILAKAEISNNSSPIKPNPIFNMAIALVVGLIVGVGLAFLLDYLDNTIKKEQDIENQLDLPVLGTITTINVNGNTKNKGSQTKINETRGESVGS